MPLKLMTVEEWIAIPDNPIQRDTERHARKAKHLRTPVKTHWVCHAGQFPDKKYIKLDGHTRALLWKRKEIPEPPTGLLEVHVFPVKNIEEAMELYKTYDSREALETVPDKVSGAFHHLGFVPKSALLQRGSINSAMKVCWNIWKGRGPMNPGVKANGETKKDYEVYEAMAQFASELYILDSFMVDHKSVPGGIVAAFILTHRKHGSEPMKKFWLGFFGDGGEKSGGKMDGVQALTELVLARKGKHLVGSNQVLDLTARAVGACEIWLQDELTTRAPPPHDLHGYIANLKPQVRLLKAGRKEEREGAHI